MMPATVAELTAVQLSYHLIGFRHLLRVWGEGTLPLGLRLTRVLGLLAPPVLLRLLALAVLLGLRLDVVLGLGQALTVAAF